MPQCIAITTTRRQCTMDGVRFEHHCTRHFNMKMASDAEFRTRYEVSLAMAERAAREEVEERERRAVEARQRLVAAEAARREAELAARRAEKTIKRDRHIAAVPTIGPLKIVDHARKAVDIWDANNIPGYDIPAAYAALAYNPQSHVGFIGLMTAIVKLRFQALGNHPEHMTYREVPEEERRAVLDEIHTGLLQYTDFVWERVLGDTDPVRARVTARQRAEAEEARRVAAAAAEAARREAFNAQLRREPVVFQRDPEGSINLRAFATDTQNIHRSSVQSATHKAVIALLARPALADVDVLEEITTAFNDVSLVRWYGPGRHGAERTRDDAITELTNDYFNTEAFNVRYGDVVDRVWAFIRGHEHHPTLCTRLAQEVYEGRGMCTNGKMARLVNVLQGFDDTLAAEAPREVFQSRIAVLRQRPLAEREAAARELFREFNIAEEEHDIWLEPLLEPDEAPVEALAEVAIA